MPQGPFDPMPPPPAYQSFPQRGGYAAPRPTVPITGNVGYKAAPSHLENAGMKGTPELLPDDIGRLDKFETHVKAYNAYAMEMTHKGKAHLSLAYTMIKYATSLATAFTAQTLKRYRMAPHTHRDGDLVYFTPQHVLALSDDDFTRLYTETCSVSVEDPSQVIHRLVGIQYVRQLPNEPSPMSSILRAEAAFRNALSLLPQHAVSQCHHMEIRDAFLKMVFSEQKWQYVKLDFQHCQTWEQVKDQLIHRAANSSGWYQHLPTSTTTPLISTPQSSTSPANMTSGGSGAATGGQSSDNKDASNAYWKKQFDQLQSSVPHDPKILEGLITHKKMVKKLQQLKYRRELEADIRKQVQKEVNSSSSRDRSQDRGSAAPRATSAATPSANDNQRDDKSITCYNCGETGHRRDKCPKPQRSRSQSPRAGAGGGGGAH